MSPDNCQEEEIFRTACQLPTAEEREKFLGQACAGAPDLLRRIQARLAGAGPTGEGSDGPPLIEAQSVPPVISAPTIVRRESGPSRSVAVIAVTCIGLILLLGVAVVLVRKAQVRRELAEQARRAAVLRAERETRQAQQTESAKAATVPLAGRSPMQLVSQGNAFGSMGDWRQAFACFQQVLAAGSTREGDWSWAAAAALAAGETNAAVELAQGLMERFGSRQDPAMVERCLKQCLCLPYLPAALLEKISERTEYTVAANPNDRWRQLVKGMTEFRHGQWSNALEWLRLPERSSNPEVAALALPFGAMARHQIGDIEGARLALAELNRRLGAMVQVGQLAASRNNTWDNFARAFTLRAEAERLILGREVSPPVDPAVVRENARRRQMIERLIETAERLALRQQWTQACEVYVQAQGQPGFDWEWSELTQDILVQKMAVVFLLAGDEARHRALCETMLSRTNHSLPLTTQERYASICVLNTGQFSPELKERTFAWTRQLAQTEGADRSAWCALVLGIAEYRQGRHTEALPLLEQAEATSDLMARVRARAFHAMACARLGREAEARQALSAAQELSASGQREGWWAVAFSHLALEELKALLKPAADAKPPQ